jgi:AcrR family transcriptional regulator
MTVPTAPGRTRDSAASRAALLAAASALFSSGGYEATTVRDIGERAGVDSALIARYFGNKLNLYLATLEAEASEPGRVELSSDLRGYLTWLLERTDRRGPGPLMQALARSDTAPEIRAAAQAHITRRLVDPLISLLSSRGVPAASARLKAEAAVSAVIGVVVVRGTGSFTELPSASVDEVAGLLTRLVESVLQSAPEG